MAPSVARSKARAARRSACGFEQAELWPAAEPVHEVAVEPARMVAAAMPVPAVETEPVRFIDVKAMPDTKPRVLSRGVSASLHVPAAKSRPMVTTVQSSTIARFLNVNGAIEGLKSGGVRFDAPGRGGFQTLRLWKCGSDASMFSSAT